MRFRFQKEGHRYFIDEIEVPSNTTILKDLGLINGTYHNDYARDLGSNVHLATQLHDEGDLGEIDPSIEPYLTAYKKFLAESDFIPELIEVPMANHIHHYGTTIDRIGAFSSGDALLELQNECLPKRLPRFALQLKPDGTYRLHEFKDPNDRNVALAAVALWHWKNNNLKGGSNGNRTNETT